jgi:hypothetical protein
MLPQPLDYSARLAHPLDRSLYTVCIPGVHDIYTPGVTVDLNRLVAVTHVRVNVDLNVVTAEFSCVFQLRAQH